MLSQLISVWIPPPNIILGPEIMATSHDLILSLFKLYNGVVMV